MLNSEQKLRKNGEIPIRLTKQKRFELMTESGQRLGSGEVAGKLVPQFCSSTQKAGLPMETRRVRTGGPRARRLMQTAGDD
jgi:hypothetical protein